MLLIDLSKRTLTPLERETMEQAGYLERTHIQQLLCRNPGAFCEEIGEYIHFVGTELRPTDFVGDRVDILGVDPNGAAVIIEIKRKNNKLQLLQAITYAAMISEWSPARFISALKDYNGSCLDRTMSLEEAHEELLDTLDDGDVTIINNTQRILLLAEEFDYEVLVTAEWLTEKFDMDIRCFRIVLTKHNDAHILSCQRTFPPPEITDVAIKRRRQRETGLEDSASWPDALAKVDNASVKDFFTAQIKIGVSHDVSRKRLIYKDSNRIRYRVSARNAYATVVQSGRFANDEEYWTSRLSANPKLRPRNDGNSLAFCLSSPADFHAFLDAWKDLK